jgi:ankyrin repeat protein
MSLFSKNANICAIIAELLVINGANVNQKDTDNWTALHTAVRKN